MASTEIGKALHIATYATDKRKGGYLVRVTGPYPERFVGREVPVSMKSGEQHPEKLVKLIWTGIDTGTPDKPGTGKPVALYAFEPRPRDDARDEMPF